MEEEWKKATIDLVRNLLERPGGMQLKWPKSDVWHVAWSKDRTSIGHTLLFGGTSYLDKTIEGMASRLGFGLPQCEWRVR